MEIKETNKEKQAFITCLIAAIVAVLYTGGFVLTTVFYGLKGFAIYLGATAIFGFVFLGVALLCDEAIEDIRKKKNVDSE